MESHATELIFTATYPAPYFKWRFIEIFSTVILLLIQEGLLSVTSEIMCTEYWLTAKSKQ